MTLVSELANLWPENMPEMTRSGEIRREMDKLREQVREQGERHEDALNKIQQLLATLVANLPTPAATPPDEATYSVEYYHNNRNSRVEFSKFNGENLNGWIYICEHFFEYEGTPDEVKVRIAAINLEGKALKWHSAMMKARLGRGLPNWNDYVRALHHHFRQSLYEDPMAELLELK